MATTNDVKKRVFFSQQSYYDTMVEKRSVTVDGVTYVYSPSDTDYFTPYNESGGHNYSTNEQVVGTWIDGKPLYETTISANVTGNSQSITLADKGINNIGFATITESTIVDSEGLVFPLNATYQSGQLISDIQFTTLYLGVDGANSSLEVELNGDTLTAPYVIYATLHYTKTTD